MNFLTFVVARSGGRISNEKQAALVVATALMLLLSAIIWLTTASDSSYDPADYPRGTVPLEST